ncbi:hypothetical protein [Pelistega sp. MC2]|uniref:hypothetical protein n=1 Tax=Pelistega sp. MC2 TaxID=1720297 RepID=UPI0008D98408|nr:hypothetical protein [Pelistega sp. MC2]
MNKQQSQDRDTGPWYKEPWPWILMAGPLLTILGCILTIYLAYNKNIDAEIPVHAYTQGKFVSREAHEIPNVFHSTQEAQEKK